MSRLLALLLLCGAACQISAQGTDLDTGNVEPTNAPPLEGSAIPGLLTINPAGRILTYLGDTRMFRCDFEPKNFFTKDGEDAIIWLKDGNPIESSIGMADMQTTMGESFLRLTSMTASHAGMYTCNLDFDGTSYSASAELILGERPTFSATTSEHKKSFDPHAYQRVCRPGCKGQPGDQGLEGEDGPRGAAGPRGPQGPPGVTLRRPIKIQILKGAKGYAGPSGPAGRPGAHGMHGIPGIPGPSGPDGLVGRKGELGYPGLPGVPGAPGAEGPVGPKGFLGSPGINGLQGLRGDKGERGDRGAKGQQGAQGVGGSPGSPGQIGPPGDQGASGQEGEAGARGDEGDIGPTGDPGRKGDKGTQGFEGDSGFSGDKGSSGEDGLPGSQGQKGEKGQTGPEVYIRLQINHGPCTTDTAGEVAYDAELGKLYFCNGNTWECVDDGGCSGCEEFVSQWSQWSQCSVSCGSGIQERTRTVVQQPDFALQNCNLKITKRCSLGPCTQKCMYKNNMYMRGEKSYEVTTTDIAADIIVAVDESRSMGAEHAWLPSMIQRLNEILLSRGVGTGTVGNRYGLIGFGRAQPNECPKALFDNNFDLMYPWTGYAEANSHLIADQDGTQEDGYAAVKYAIEEMPYRRGTAGIARNLILITDEDRDSDCGADLNAENTQKLIEDEGFIINVALNQQYNMTSSQGGQPQFALGVQGATDGSRKGFVIQPGGTYSVLQQGSMTLSTTQIHLNRNTKKDYVDWALEIGGAAWDLNILRQGGGSSQSFTQAFVDTKTDEIINAARSCTVCTCEGPPQNPRMICRSPRANSIARLECECNFSQGTWDPTQNECL